jgi:hypothetical protein
MEYVGAGFGLVGAVASTQGTATGYLVTIGALSIGLAFGFGPTWLRERRDRTAA